MGEAQVSEGAARALAVAYAYLNRRERTVAETRTRLERAGCASADIDAALAELIELGFLDDERYARLFVQDKRELESWGVGRIVRALGDRGVERDLIAAALTDEPEEGGEEAGSEQHRAIELLRRRFPASAPPDLGARERALGVLLRKGYDAELAYDAVRAWAEDSSPR